MKLRSWASTMNLKSDASKNTKEMVLKAQKMSSKKIKTIRSDNAKEHTLGDTKAFLDENWTLIELDTHRTSSAIFTRVKWKSGETESYGI